eukprot:2782877-Rhodomonas_salina.3
MGAEAMSGPNASAVFPSKSNVEPEPGPDASSELREDAANDARPPSQYTLRTGNAWGRGLNEDRHLTTGGRCAAPAAARTCRTFKFKTPISVPLRWGVKLSRCDGADLGAGHVDSTACTASLILRPHLSPPKREG